MACGRGRHEQDDRAPSSGRADHPMGERAGAGRWRAAHLQRVPGMPPAWPPFVITQSYRTPDEDQELGKRASSQRGSLLDVEREAVQALAELDVAEQTAPLHFEQQGIARVDLLQR